jgi:glycosyltransferase involved in cell wall biosynthesis
MPNVAESLRDCALLLHCRPDEPFGIVMVEAMAARLPVVAPAAAGAAEIVSDGVTGLLYRPDDSDDAAAKVIRLLEDPHGSRRMGEAGRARVAGMFLIGAQVSAFERLLASLDNSIRRRSA